MNCYIPLSALDFVPEKWRITSRRGIKEKIKFFTTKPGRIQLP